jgi:broad specificity phosphatase PhoE
LFDARAADKWHVRVPGGENYAEVAARATDWAESLDADTFAVSHGALTRILRGLLLGLDGQAMSSLDEPQGVVFRVRGNSVTRLD